MNIHKLNLQNAVSLTAYSSNKSDSLKKVEAQATEFLKQNPPAKWEIDASAAPLKLTAINISDTARFEFIRDIEGLSSDKKKTIMHLIYQSAKGPDGGTGDYHRMHRAQTGIQLQLISEQLIPEKYQDQMNQAIKDFQNQRANHDLMIAEALQSTHDKFFSKFPELKNPSKTTNAMVLFKEQERTISSFYNDLDLSNPSKFVESFEQILTNFKNNQKALDNTPDNVLQGFQENLRTKWNDFASMFQEMQAFKLPTIQSSLHDFSV